MKRAIKTISIFLGTSFLIASCNSGGDSFEQKTAQQTNDTGAFNAVSVSEETLNNLIQSIPSPIEMTTLIKESGAKYDNSILNPSDNVDKYNTNYKKAFSIGVYSADLGYLNIYEKLIVSMEYINSIKKLSDGINVGQFFDFDMLKKLATNSKNIDSLMYISTNSFNKMDQYLREHKRGELSVLIISGAWLEGLNIATGVAKVKSSKELTDRIGEQKISLDNLMVILNAFKKDKYFANIVSEYQKLKDIYDKVLITTEYKAPETKEINGQLVVVDNSTSTINMTDAQLNEIISTTAQIRKTLLE